MYTISKQFSFSASHVLGGLPEDHPCGRLHGHNYEVVVVLEAMTITPPGFVVDYRALDSFKKHLDAVYDHHHLNDIMDQEPTAENMAADLYYWLRAQPVYGMFVVAVRVSETPKTWAEFRPEFPPLAQPPADFDAEAYVEAQRQAVAQALGVKPEDLIRLEWGPNEGGPGEPPTPQRVDDRTLSWDETRVLPAKPYQYEHEQPKLKKRCCQEPDEEPSDTPLTDSLLWMKGLLEGGDDDALSGE
jgi:6-pyruvoyltetrahydropterin/6-carboxytetrahydropterin synthase